MIPTALLGMAGAAGPAAQFNQLNAALMEVTNTIRKFTDAINPALGQMLTQTFNDLNATIGVALQPAMKAIIPVVRQIANTMLPIMEKLSGVVGGVSGSLGGAFRKIIDALGVALTRMMPIIHHFGTMMATLADLMGSNLSVVIQNVAMMLGIVMKLMTPNLAMIRALAKALADVMRGVEVVAAGVFQMLIAIGDSIAAMFGNSIMDGVNAALTAFQKAIQSVVKAVVIMTASIMRLFGSKSGIQAMIDVIQGKLKAQQKDTTGLAVLQSPAYKAIDQLGRDISLASFAGSMAGGEDPKKPEDFLKDIAGTLEKIQQADPVAELMRFLEQKITGLASELVSGFGKIMAETFNERVFTPAQQNIQKQVGGMAKDAATFVGAGPAGWAIRKLTR